MAPSHPDGRKAPDTMHRTSMTPPLTVGVVGTGGISHAHAPAWPVLGAELHVFSTEGAEEYARRYGATVHESLPSLLAAVDLVDVTTPTLAHPDVVHAALDAGCDVLCEKPLARTVCEAQELVDHAARAGRLLFPAHVVRYFPEYAAARRAVRRGDLGELAVLRFERTGTSPDRPWFHDVAASGGILMDQMIHDLDQALWLAGPATSVYAAEHAGADGRVRSAHAVLEHRDGAISHCRGFWGPPGTRFRTTFSLSGTGGRLDHDSALHPVLAWDEVARSAEAEGNGFLPEVAAEDSPYVAEILDAVRSRAAGRAPGVSPADGVAAVAVAEAALQSIAEGRRIPC